MSEYINITQMNTAIPGLGITGQFIIDTLKLPPARQEKRALFWRVTDWPVICERLTAHVAKGASTDISKLSGERSPPKQRTDPPAASGQGGDSFFDDAAPADDQGSDDFFGDAPAEQSNDEMFG